MMLELRRVFAGIGSRGRKRLAFEIVGLPALIALVMTSAFVARSEPSSHGDAFIFFGTLYAFWCGLFATCQAFNGEVQTGEWSYWMLGMRRAVVRHYAAHFIAALLLASAQVALSLVFLKVFWWVGANVPFFQRLFLGQGKPFINQIGCLFDGGYAYNIQGIKAAMDAANNAVGEPNRLWFGFCLSYYAGGAAMAVVAGVSVGLLVSAACPTPQTSLTVSVFLVVACTIFSHTGIGGTSGGSVDTREFAPMRLILSQKGREYRSATEANPATQAQTRWQDGGVVEHTSLLIPQRYFFNIARIPRLKLESSLRNWSEPSRLVEHSRNKADFCKCPACLGLISVTETNVNGIATYHLDDGPFHTTLDGFQHWTQCGKADGKWTGLLFPDGSPYPEEFKTAVKDNRGGVKTLFRLCRTMAWTEAVILLVWCILYGFITVVILNRRGMFHELR